MCGRLRCNVIFKKKITKVIRDEAAKLNIRNVSPHFLGLSHHNESLFGRASLLLQLWLIQKSLQMFFSKNHFSLKKPRSQSHFDKAINYDFSKSPS